MAEEKGFSENILGDNMVDQFQRGLVSILGGGSLLGTSMNEYDEAYQQGIESGMTPEEVLDLLGPRPELMGKANGGRVGLQEGGPPLEEIPITTPEDPRTYPDTIAGPYGDIVKQIMESYPTGDTQTIQRPSPQVEALQSVLAPQLASFLGSPVSPLGGTTMY